MPTESRDGQDPLPLWTSWGVEEFLAPAEIRIPNCLALSLSTKLCYVGSKEYVFFFLIFPGYIIVGFCYMAQCMFVHMCQRFRRSIVFPASCGEILLPHRGRTREANTVVKKWGPFFIHHCSVTQVNQGLLCEVPWPHSEGLPWTSDKHFSETSTCTTHSTQNRQTSMVHGRFRTLCPSKRAVEDPRLRPRFYWNRYTMPVLVYFSTTCNNVSENGNFSTAEKATIIALLYYCYEVTLTLTV